MRKTKKALATLAIMGMAVTLAPFNVLAATGVTTDRLQGTTRIGTAIDVAEQFQTPTIVILAPSENAHLVDALAAAPLAGKNSPILLTEGNTLNVDTKAELIKLKVTKVYVVGAIDEAVVAQVKAISGITEVIAIKGATRIETAAKISAELTSPEGTFVVGFEGLADALSVSSFAAAHNYSILVTNPDGSLPASAKLVGNKYTVGGVQRVKRIADVESLAGSDRYATNKEVLEKLAYSYDKAYVANGTNEHYVDALIASKLAAQANAPIVLTDTAIGGDAVAAYVGSQLADHAVVVALGGDKVVTVDTVKKFTNSATAQEAIDAVNAANPTKVAMKAALEANSVALGINITGDYKEANFVAQNRQGSVAQYVIDSQTVYGRITYTTIGQIQAAFNAGVVYETNKLAFSTKVASGTETIADVTAMKATYLAHGQYRGYFAPDGTVKGNVEPIFIANWGTITNFIAATPAEQAAAIAAVKAGVTATPQTVNPYSINNVFIAIQAAL